MNEEKYNLKNSLIDFAVRINRLSERLPCTNAGKHISGEILQEKMIIEHSVLNIEH